MVSRLPVCAARIGKLRARRNLQEILKNRGSVPKKSQRAQRKFRESEPSAYQPFWRRTPQRHRWRALVNRFPCRTMAGMLPRALTSIILVMAFTLPAAAQARLRTPSQNAERTGTFAVLRLRVGVDANPKAATSYRQEDYKDSIALMRTTGANNFHYAKVWRELEPTTGNYDLNDVRFMMAQSSPLPVAFNLKLIDAGARNMPDAYRALAWDSPQMVEHVVAVIEQLAPVLGDRPWSYALGNEIDLYFASRSGEVAAYARLLAQVKPRVAALHPEASFTTSFQASAAPQLSTLYAPIVATLDHVAFTYYPLRGDFSVRPPTDVTADLRTMIAAAQPRPIYLQEIGYPSAARLGSSPDLQSTFVRLAYEAIRDAGTSRVLGATYLFQSDFPNWLVDQIVLAYGVGTDNFRAFIGTLGLRDDKDKPKPAWDEFMRQAQITAPKPPAPSNN